MRTLVVADVVATGRLLLGVLLLRQLAESCHMQGDSGLSLAEEFNALTCKAGALPAELWPLCRYLADSRCGCDAEWLHTGYV